MPDVFISEKDKLQHPKVRNLPASPDKIAPARSPHQFIKHKFPPASVHHLPGHSHFPLSALSYYPDKVEFENKDPEEKVILLLRKHPITNLGWVMMTFLLLIAPAFISSFQFFEALPFGLKIILTLTWYLVTFGFAYEKFLTWFFSVNIVTDERLFDVEFVNLIYRKMTDAQIDRIQDVTVQMGGGIRTMFNFGDLIIQTASEIPEIEFEAVPEPDKVAKVLRELRVEEEQEKLEGRVR